MKKHIFIILSVFIITCEINSQVNYKGLVIDNAGDRISFAKLISLNSMEYWETDIDGKYDFFSRKELVITVNYSGFKRFDRKISTDDTITIFPMDYQGVQLLPFPWHYQHFNSSFGDFETRKEYLQKKINWIELESFESRYKGEKYHSYQWTNDEKIIYNNKLETILLQDQSFDKKQKIVLHHIDKDLIKEFGRKLI